MHSTTVLLYSAILLSLSLCKAQVTPQYINGSLSTIWNFNFTFFTKYLEGNILYFADYEKNIFMISVNKNGNDAKSVYIRYNKEHKSVDLKYLCGCYTCDDKMMNFFIKSSKGVIELTCNNYKHETLQKEDIKNRKNPHITKYIQSKTNKINTIYTSIAINTTGCLESFYYDRTLIYFDENGSKFLAKCPKSCIIGACNDGNCTALNPDGPMCNCYSTALNGPYCNKTMVSYIPGSNLSYTRINESFDVQMKFSWKKSLDEKAVKKYCLLEFVNAYDHITLSIQQSVLMKGSEIISKINSEGVNFMLVTVTKDGGVIKVNNNIIQYKLAILGKFSLNVGFTGKTEKCDTLIGIYDFEFNSSQLSRVNHMETSTIIVNSISGPIKQFQMNLTIIILASGSSFLVSVVFLSLFLAIVCIRRQSLKGRRTITENVYDSNNVRVNFRANPEMLEDGFPYDIVEDDDAVQPVLQFNSLSLLRFNHSPLPPPPPRLSQ